MNFVLLGSGLLKVSRVANLALQARILRLEHLTARCALLVILLGLFPLNAWHVKQGLGHMLLLVNLLVCRACLVPLVLLELVYAVLVQMETFLDQELQVATPAATDNCSPRTKPALQLLQLQLVCGETLSSTRCYSSVL